MDIKKEEETDIDPYVLRVRGLPWSASKDEILKFFDGCKIKEEGAGIHMTMSREGRPSGEAYVEFETPEDADKGLEKNNEHIGSRYIEVFRSKQNEMDWALRKCGLDGEEAFGDACVRLRGLPFGCSKEEIAQFFTGLEIVRNGITLPTDFQGRSTGEAYVQFASQEIAEKAMGKHKEKIGHRYIEIFKSSLQEIRSALGMGPVRMRTMGTNRMSPYDRMDRPSAFGRGRGGGGGGAATRGRPSPSGGNFMDRGAFGGERIRDTGHNIHLRGLPFRAVERDIFEFFAPVKPVAVRIKFEPSGRSSGEADAMFGTHEDALRAMKKDKEKIQHRYIELFLQSEPDPFRGDSMPYGGGGPGQFGRGAGGRPFMGDGESGFSPGGMGPDAGYGPGMGADRGFGRPGMGTQPNRGFGPPVAGGYGTGAARGFGMGGGGAAAGAAMGGNDHDFGGYSTEKAFPQMAAGERGFGGNMAGRTFPSVQPNRPFANADRFPTEDRGYSSMGEGFRNGMGAGTMPAGNMRNENNFNNDRTNNSDFYGSSGKMFGESVYSTNQSMMNATTYPGF